MIMAQGDCAKILLALVFLAYVTNTEEVGAQRLCGTNLVEALLFVCEHKGFFFKPWNDSVLKKSPLGNLLPKKRIKNKKLGIVEKCCFSFCTYYDLESYCNN